MHGANVNTDRADRRTKTKYTDKQGQYLVLIYYYFLPTNWQPEATKLRTIVVRRSYIPWTRVIRAT